MIALFLALLYLLVAAAVYVSDGWFDYFDDNNDYLNDDFGIILCSLFWPVTWLFLIGTFLKRNLKSKREQYDEKKEQETRIRVAEVKKAEAELALIENQLEQELRSSYKTRHV